MFWEENFALVIRLASGLIEKFKAVCKFELSKCVFAKFAPLKSQFLKLEFLRSVSAKSTCSSLQPLKGVPLSFSLKNDEKLRMQSSKFNESKKFVHSSKLHIPKACAF